MRAVREFAAPLHAEFTRLFLRRFDDVGLQKYLRTRPVKMVDQRQHALLFNRRALQNERVVVFVDFDHGILVARDEFGKAFFEGLRVGISDVHDLHREGARVGGRLIGFGELIVEVHHPGKTLLFRERHDLQDVPLPLPVKAVRIQNGEEHVRPTGVFDVDARRFLDAGGHHEAHPRGVGHRAQHCVHAGILKFERDALAGERLFLTLQRSVGLRQENARFGLQIRGRRRIALAIPGFLLPVFGEFVRNVFGVAGGAAREYQGGERDGQNRFEIHHSHNGQPLNCRLRRAVG